MWNYRIIKDGDTFGLYEVFYNDAGEIFAHSEEAEVYGDNVGDIIKSLKLMLKDANKHQATHGNATLSLVLEKDEIEFVPFCEETEGTEIKNLEDYR